MHCYRNTDQNGCKTGKLHLLYYHSPAYRKKLLLKPQDILEGKAAGIAKKLQTAKLAKQLGIGELTLADIVKELEKPSRDPRDEMPKPILRSDVLSMEDLKPDMELREQLEMLLILEHLSI